MTFQLSMYYLSFAPLWLVVIFMDIFSIFNGETNLLTEYVSIPLIVLVFIFAFMNVRKGLNPAKRDNTQEYQLESAGEEKFLAAELLMSYVLPLFAFDFTKFQGVFLFSVFFIIFGWLCIKHNYFCVNIVLEAMKYKVYDCTYQTFDDITIKKKVISKRALSQCRGETIRVRGLNNEYMLDCYTSQNSKKNNRDEMQKILLN